MIQGIGIDIVQVDRIASLVQRYGKRFVQRILTEEEISAWARRRDQSVFLAGRFAAKEAVFKALGTGLSHGISFRDVTVVRTDSRPTLRLSGKADLRAREMNVSRMQLSISHEKSYAVAMVILEGDQEECSS
ncbi:MAG: holo-ACP synthase [Desulfomonilia bacterium]